jgi:hypothetical protein
MERLEVGSDGLLAAPSQSLYGLDDNFRSLIEAFGDLGYTVFVRSALGHGQPTFTSRIGRKHTQFAAQWRVRISPAAINC